MSSWDLYCSTGCFGGSFSNLMILVFCNSQFMGLLGVDSGIFGADSCFYVSCMDDRC